MKPQTRRAASMVLTAVAAAPAQEQFRVVTKEHVIASASARVAVSDADRDGDVDLLAVHPTGNASLIRLFRNDGFGVFSGGVPFGPDSTILLAFDADGDADDDLLLGGSSGPVELWRNDGAGNYAPAAPLPRVVNVSMVAAGDVDGDRDLDLILGSYVGSSFFGGVPEVLLLNVGGGQFAAAAATQLPADTDWTVSLAFGDVDADGDLDLVCGNTITQAWTSDRLYLNDGRGVFTHAPAGALPPESRPETRMAFLDCDGDGDQDLLCAREGRPTGGPALALYTNQGTGRFTDGTAAWLPPDPTPFHHGFVLCDLDRDARLDIVLDGENPYWLRRGATGPYQTAGTILPGSAIVDKVPAAAADLNGDGRLDLVFARGPAVSLLFQDASGGFQDGCRWPARQGQSRTMFVDIDADRDPDVVTGQGWVLRNDGQGVFADVTGAALPPAATTRQLLQHGDIDGDGDADLVGVDLAPVRYVMLANRGNGTFQDVSATHAPPPPAQLTAWHIELVDVERDADLDMVVADANGGGAWLYLNDGTGRYIDGTAGRMPSTVGYQTIAFAAVDVERDGDADLVLCNAGWVAPSQSLLLVNDGRGVFTDATAGRLPAGPEHPSGLAVGDIDRDGALDLVYGGYTSPSRPNVRMRIHRNDGSGRFTDITTSNPWLSGVPTLVDIDEDGDLDLTGDVTNPVHLNDGRGSFTPAARGQAGGGAVADIDGDGDLDVSLVTNHHRQLRTPYLLIAGGPYAVVLESQPGYGVADAWGACLLGTRALDPGVPLPPWGVLRVDPAVAIVLPAVRIPAGVGRAEQRFLVPATTFVHGIDFYLQALIVPATSPLDARFTGRITDRGL